MKTIKQVPVIVEHVPEYLHADDEMKEGVIYVSKVFLTAVHKCLCGCGEKTVTPIHNEGWTLNETDKGVTMTPSIYNRQYACKSHYIITNGIANFV